ncbi:MAG: VanZ family protein [Nitrosomonas sp.]|nr:VanZ family protein [Nitrosomonas sp.]
MQNHFRYLLPICYMAALFYVSSMPGHIMEADPAFGLLTPNLQNLLHVPVYGGLALSWWWALETHVTAKKSRLITAFTLTVMYGIVDESWQLYIPGRYGSLTDLALNALGAAIALWVVARHSAHPSQNLK